VTELERRTECLSVLSVGEPVITRHEVHCCRKRPGHPEPHRCWACTTTWITESTHT